MSKINMPYIFDINGANESEILKSYYKIVLVFVLYSTNINVVGFCLVRLNTLRSSQQLCLYSTNINVVGFCLVRLNTLRSSQQLWPCRDGQFT